MNFNNLLNKFIYVINNILVTQVNMTDFTTAKNKFMSSFDTSKLINTLKNLDDAGITPGDYTAFGCEFILNGVNADPDNECWSTSEFIEDEYENVRAHNFPLINNWDSWLFYNPSDIRGLVFDFSHLYTKNKIICYSGLGGPDHGYEVVIEFTIDEFLEEYGISRFYSVCHWNVTWKNIGFSWNN